MDGVSPLAKTDAELVPGVTIEAELAVRTRAGTEGLFLCLEGLGDVKLMTGEVRCCWDDVSDTTRARDGVDGTMFRFPLTLCFPIVLVEVEDNERKKTPGGRVSGRREAGREILPLVERFSGVVGTVEFELGLTVVHTLASLVIDSVRVLREDRVFEDVVREMERRERVDDSEGVGMIV